MRVFFLFVALLVHVACNGQSATPNVPAQVAVFLSCECPISQKYVPVLNKIYEAYGEKDGIQWKFIVPDRISKKALKAFVKEYEVKFPIEIDDGKQHLTS